MKSVFMLAAANLRRHRGASITLGLLVLIAALLLNLGIMSITEFTTLFSRKLDELHTPYVSATFADELGANRQAQLEHLVANNPSVTETCTEKVLSFPAASFSLKSSSYSNGVILEDVSESSKMGKFSLVGTQGKLAGNSIYAPYILKTKGYDVGDNLTITCRGKSYKFVIAGFTEDIMFGTLDTGGIRFFLPNSSYKKVADSLNDKSVSAVLLNARTKTIDEAADLYDTINKQTSQNSKDVMLIESFSIDIVKLADSMPVSIGSSMEIAFAFIVALVLLLVVHFRIVNSIEEDMQNIGALEAVGYTSRQIRGGFVLQFLTTAVFGSAAGIALSYATAVPHGKMLAAETGLNFEQSFNMPANLITLFAMLACVAAVALLATRRIKKLPVVVALRGGIKTHSFRRNHMPLDRTRGPLNLLLSMKTLFANARQNTALVIILAFVSFASVFVFMLFYNFNVDNAMTVHILGGETPDIMIGAQSADDARALLTDLPKMPNITQAISIGYATFDVNGKSGYGRIVADYSKLKNNQTYEGRYPKHDNEVAIGGLLAARLNKQIGDTVSLTCGDQKRDFIITGFVQSINTLGKGVFITDAGMLRLDSNYRPVTIYAYLYKNAGVSDTMRSINSSYGSKINSISNERAAMLGALNTYEAVVAAFALVIFIVMALIVILILSLITGAALVRRRQELGIEKALGFTTRQLVLQISAGFLPVALIGSLAGGVLGFLGANPLLSCLFRAMGIMKVDFFLPSISVPLICIVITLLTLIISMIAAQRVRKITPCALANE